MVGLAPKSIKVIISTATPIRTNEFIAREKERENIELAARGDIDVLTWC